MHPIFGLLRGQIRRASTASARGVLHRAEERELAALQRRRRDEPRFVAEGVRLVADLLASDVRIAWAAVSDSAASHPVAEVLRRRVARCVILNDAEFARVCGTDSPQGVLAVAEVPSHPLGTVVGAQLLLVSDGVQEPGNIGALVRSAEALGAGGLLTLPGTVDPWNPKAVRASMGSSFRMPILPVGRDAASQPQPAPAFAVSSSAAPSPAGWTAVRSWLRQQGFTVLASAAHGVPIRRYLEPGAGGGVTTSSSSGNGSFGGADGGAARRYALIVGNEGAGVSPSVLATADAVVSVPLRGRAESLNCAAAAAILLHELAATLA